jgi:ribose transport system permease protein
MKKFAFQKRLTKFLNYDEAGVIISIIVVVAFFTVLNRNFFSLHNFRGLFAQIPFICVTALGVSMTMMAGHSDISTGKVAGLAGIFMAWLIVDFHWAAPPAIIAGLLVAILCGMINGFFVVYFNIPDIVITLAMFYIVGGMRYLFIKGYQLQLNDLPDFVLNKIFDNRYFGLHITFWIMVILAVIMTFVIKKTTFGRRLLATGDNKEVALLAGININFYKMVAFMTCSFLAGIAGIIMALDLGIGLPETGDGWEFRAILGAIVGGTGLMGGKCSPIGVLLGVLLVFIAENGVIFMGVPATFQPAVQGILLAIAVTIDLQRRNKKIPAE